MALPSVHSKKYENAVGVPVVFPDGLSLESCEGNQNADLIEFIYDGVLINNVIRDLPPLGADKTAPFPLYHEHVLWSLVHYTLILKDGKFAFMLEYVGPHLSNDNCGLTRNRSLKQERPDIVAATCTFTNVKGEESGEAWPLQFAESAGAPTRINGRIFTRQEMDAQAVDGIIHFRVRVIVARSYFTLSKLLKDPTTVSKTKEDTVKGILRGEIPDGSDVTFATQPEQGDGVQYHMHIVALARFGDKFKPIAQAALKKVSTGPKPIMKFQFTPNELAVVVHIAYGMEAPLPVDVDRLKDFAGVWLEMMLDKPVLQSVFMQWERAICEHALALDKYNRTSFIDIIRLGRAVWALPYGSTPAAKRVVIGVCADMVWLQYPVNRSFVNFLSDVMGGRAKVERNEDTRQIFMSVITHLSSMIGMRKVGIAEKNGEKEQQSLPLRDLNEHTVVSIDDRIEESDEDQGQEEDG